MQLPTHEVELAVSTEESRYTLRAIKVDVEGKRVMATDGYILAIVPCEPAPEDHSALIPLDAVKQIRQMQKRAKSVPVNVTTNSKITAHGVSETAEFEAMTGQFPNVDMVIPKFEGGCTVCLNAELLYKLAKALTPKGEDLIISLWIKDAQSGVLVKSSRGEGSVGVIMPCRP